MTVVIQRLSLQQQGEMAKIIRAALTEYGANKAGFAWADPQVDHLYETYHDDRRLYLTIVKDGIVVGGGGIASLEGDDPTVCELQKMYLAPAIRGYGWGRKLMTELLDFARLSGYQICYLETLQSMLEANQMYQKFDFKQLDEPMGNTGHGGCDRWYALTLSPDGN